MPRYSEVGFPPETMYCSMGLRQRLDERIYAVRREQRKQGPLMRKHSDNRIKAIEMLIAEIERRWDLGQQQIRKKDFHELEQKAEAWRATAAKLLNAKSNLRETQARVARRQREVEAATKQTAAKELAFQQGRAAGLNEAVQITTGPTKPKE